LQGQDSDSLQTLELKAVVWAFHHWQNEPLNVVSDSLYVVGVTGHLERVMVRQIKNNTLYVLLLQLSHLLGQRQHPYFITHIRSHQFSQGLAIGNNAADWLVSVAQLGAVNLFEQACLSHDFFHQSAKMLAKQFSISVGDARRIVQSCPACQKVGFGLGLGVNPRGLKALQVWQMDVTHIPEFGRLKYVHVSINTFSHTMWATAQTGETAKHAIKHIHVAISVLGIAQELKTDNGPAYTSKTFAWFCHMWGVHHITGILHSSTGQAIVERAHGILKLLLKKQKGKTWESPTECVAKALYVLNYLHLTENRGSPPVVVHQLSLQPEVQGSTPAKILYHDLTSGE